MTELFEFYAAMVAIAVMIGLALAAAAIAICLLPPEYNGRDNGP